MENLNNQNNEEVVNDIQANPESEVDTQNNPSEKTFTQDQLNKILAKEISKAKSKWDKEKSEAERLAKMSAEERAKEELAKEKQKIAEERAELDRIKLLQQTQLELANREVPREFAEWIVGADAESTNDRIKALKEIWDQAIANTLNTKLAGRAPRIQSDDEKPDTRLSKSEFKKMSLADQQKLFVEDPELYKKLTEK